MDWVVSVLRRWLGLQADVVSLQARLLATEDDLREMQKRYDDLRRATEIGLGNLDRDMTALRMSLVAHREPERKPVVQSKNWMHAKLLMGDEVDV